MTLRVDFLKDLYKEILGPMGGHEELIKGSNPNYNYIIGTLAPEISDEDQDFSDITTPEEQLVLPVNTSEEDEGDESAEELETSLSKPPLDPKSMPRSMGITFDIGSDQGSTFDFCLTWARYVKENCDDQDCWRRQGRFFVGKLIVGDNQEMFLDEKGRVRTSREGSELRIYFNCSKAGQRKFHVSIYVINVINSIKKDFVDNIVFQPQVRVRLSREQRLEPSVPESGDEETVRSEDLNRTRKTYGSGHLCSIVWEDVDPEREIGNPESQIMTEVDSQRYPFTWMDSVLLTEYERRKFLHPSIRSEFIPVYLWDSPDFNLEMSSAHLEADKLAETFDSEKLGSMLDQLVNSYETWANSGSETKSETLNFQRRLVQSSLDSMKCSIGLLRDDDEIRAAFCFANKAIHLSNSWSNPVAFRWRPFQLGFILTVLESIADGRSPNRGNLDLLWAPTGGGKTEAYQFLIAFTMALRRRRSGRRVKNRGDIGTSVISRYTLRLLTIQQFRRTLRLVTACEYLRVLNLKTISSVGWRPTGMKVNERFAWGDVAFSTGLWVGQSVTPNHLLDSKWKEPNGRLHTQAGALSILSGKRGDGDPAQIINCPVCNTYLSIPDMGVSSGKVLHFIIESSDFGNLAILLRDGVGHQNYGFNLEYANVSNPFAEKKYGVVSLKFSTSIMPRDLSTFFSKLNPGDSSICKLVSLSWIKPGYFGRSFVNKQNNVDPFDFDIFCPNPECKTGTAWCSGLPKGKLHLPQDSFLAINNLDSGVVLPNRDEFVEVHPVFRYKGSKNFSIKIPIAAMTVDEQIFSNPPTVLISTADKFVRGAYEPRVAHIFGNVEYHHSKHGFYRLAENDTGKHLSPMKIDGIPIYMETGPLLPPDLIIQDEMHLVEGPLGSLMGILEMSIDRLCSSGEIPIKYIASSATVRKVEDQVMAAFCRNARVFPQPLNRNDDRFFFKTEEALQLSSVSRGRLYVGIVSPGRGAITPLIRIISRLMQTYTEISGDPDSDKFKTLVGYFNSIRELGGTYETYRQDVDQWMTHKFGHSRRYLDTSGGTLEISGRTSSTELPSALERLQSSGTDSPDILFTTSMFGTGIDISRLGLMLVNGQPKSSSSYIQATGRIGRSGPGLVVTFYRASRPRDLSHYENFISYHRRIDSYVEPPTVSPFSPGAVEMALGLGAVFLLRCSRQFSDLCTKGDASNFHGDVEIMAREELKKVISRRVSMQPFSSGAREDEVLDFINSKLDRWKRFNLPVGGGDKTVFSESKITRNRLVLGDIMNQSRGVEVVFRNAPQSLRDIETSLSFELIRGN
jgi:hypothetical protein